MRPPRLLAAGLLAASAAVFVIASTEMLRRITAFNRDELPARPYFMPVEQPEFRYAGREVSFDTIDSDDGGPNRVIVRYGDADPIELRETIPNEIGAVPDLRRFEEWLRVYRMVMVRGTTVEQALEAVDRDELDDRLVMVMLRPPAGAASGGWGRVWVSDYRFDLFEFTEDGRIVRESLKYPSKRERGEPVPDGELVEGTWQYDAAMASLPPVYRAEPVDNQNASLVMGWTFPVAGTSALTGMIALILLLVSAPRADRGDSASTTPAA
ncbi:MAG: hypothetical protein ACTS22_03395 [Phycisphaerales bacterium]